MQHGAAEANSLIDALCGERARRASLFRRTQRLWYVVRYYRKSQIARRLLKVAQRAIVRFAGSSAVSNGERVAWRGEMAAVALSPLWKRRCTPRRVERALARMASLRQRRFCFLGVERSLGEPIDWHLGTWNDAPQLWKFHLHYHDDLLDLAFAARATHDSTLLAEAWSLVEQWIAANPEGRPTLQHDAWHPFCISRRTVNWLLLWSIEPPPAEQAQTVAQSLRAQAAFLSTHLELDLRGNHLLENLRALALAGVFFAGADAQRWLQTVIRLLPKEIDEQILSSGEHFERSPMYHALMLEAMLDIRDALHALRSHNAATESSDSTTSAIDATALEKLETLCTTTAGRMARFLEMILHPDGDFPLFGDSAFDELIDPRRLILAAGEETASFPPQERRTVEAVNFSTAAVSAIETETSDTARSIASPITSPLVATGAMRNADFRPAGPARRVGDYWTFRDGDDFLIFDAGPVGADHLPAHAHADLLGLEASVGGRRLLVDSGVFNYEDDTWRCYCRSTLAHNTAMIDHENQCDMWSKFRMGYRGWPSQLETGQSGMFHWARASHNAYRRLGVARLWRWLACQVDGPWICVDWIERPTRRLLVNQLHLHPHAQVRQIDACRFSIQLGVELLQLILLGAENASLHEFWYCPRFGERRPSSTIWWTALDRRACGWALLRDASTATSTHIELTCDGFKPVVHYTGQSGNTQMSPASLAPEQEQN